MENGQCNFDGLGVQAQIGMTVRISRRNNLADLEKEFATGKDDHYGKFKYDEKEVKLLMCMTNNERRVACEINL